MLWRIAVRRIYLDYNATTPIAPEVRQAMQPFLAEHFGNPSSDHSLGRACSEAISDAREQIAGLIGADGDEIIFTGGGTESNNMALKGIFLGDTSFLSGHMIISAIEHPATTEPATYLQKHGVDVTVVPCDGNGFVNPDDVRAAIRTDTRLLSIMLANNEVGALQPIPEIAKICQERGVLVHTDAAQAIGKVNVNVRELGVDMLSIAGHKLYAPKGIGAFYVRDSVDIASLLHGAPHERGLRAGTENTPYIVGLGLAAKLAYARLQQNGFDTEKRDALCNALFEALPDKIVCNSELESCLPNTLSVAFQNVNGGELLKATPEVCASLGAACNSVSTKVSATLAAMGVSEQQALGTIRLSTGAFSTDDDIERAATLLTESYHRIT
jgi:cysteine desulfurase